MPPVVRDRYGISSRAYIRSTVLRLNLILDFAVLEMLRITVNFARMSFCDEYLISSRTRVRALAYLTKHYLWFGQTEREREIRILRTHVISDAERGGISNILSDKYTRTRKRTTSGLRVNI